jgi:photosystem II stability/assembly factor-like uncharacterized protein
MKMLNKALLISLVLILSVSQSGSVTAGVDAWASIGPEGGSILALAVNPVTRSVVYAGTYLGGVYKSTNGGASWQPSNNGLGNFYVSALLIDPQTPSNIFALTRGGVFKSINSGESWALLDTTDIFFEIYNALAMDPQTPSILYGTAGHVYKTTDGGLTWNSFSSGLPTGDSARLLAIDPQTPAIVYTITASNSVYKTINGGLSWSKLSLTDDLAHAGDLNALLVDPKTANTLYLLSRAGGVWKSVNGGANWAHADAGLTNTFLYDLVIDPENPSILYAAGAGYEGGVFKTTNGGNTWSVASSGLYDPNPNWLKHADARAIAIDPQTPSSLYVGLWDYHSIGQLVIGGGIFKTTNSAGSWVRANSGLKNISIPALAIDPHNPAVVYAGAYPSGIYKTTNQGTNWAWRGTDLIGYNTSTLIIDPSLPSTLYLGLGSAGVYKSTDSGEHWAAAKTGLSGPYGPANVTSLVIDVQHPAILFAGAGDNVYKTIDGGATWNPASTQALPSDMDARILAIDPKTPTTLYAGGFLAAIYKSTDGGESWSPKNTGFPGSGHPIICSLVVDPITPTTLYAGTEQNGVYKSTDGGDHWNPANTGLPAEADFGYIYANALAIDPQTPSTLYVGLGSGPNSQTYPELEGGVFKSIDSGDHWFMFSSGLTDFFINVLAVSPSDPTIVYAATDGGGVYRIQIATAEPGAFNKVEPTNGATNLLNSVMLTWSPSSQAAYYEVCVGSASPCEGAWTHVDGANIIWRDLDPLTVYTWQVRAVNSLGTTYANSVNSATWSFTTGRFFPLYLPLIRRGQ